MMETSKVPLEAFDKLTMPGCYAALSYCWRNKSNLQKDRPRPCTANSTTLGRLHVGIPTSELPLTLRHATQVCQWLGIEYIWIDSLCILQDSAADWEVEAATMEMVYSMAKITIIAASSTSYDSGFYRTHVILLVRYQAKWSSHTRSRTTERVKSASTCRAMT